MKRFTAQVSPQIRMIAIAVLFAFCMTMMLPADAAAANKNPQTASSMVQGTNANGDVFSGILTITSFAQQNGQLVANGTVTGLVTPKGGTATPVTQSFTNAPVASLSATCPILNLVLGPLSLDLLGLQINLNQVVLNIVAQGGAGNLLGNLLCAVANLLNGGNIGAILGQIVGLLNQILAALGGL